MNRLAVVVVVTQIGAGCATKEDPKASVDNDSLSGGAGASGSACVHVTTSDPDRMDSDTLPEGACNPAEPPCDLILRMACGCPPYPGPRAPYRCVCSDGMWACSVSGLVDGRVCDPTCEGGAAGSTAGGAGNGS